MFGVGASLIMVGLIVGFGMPVRLGSGSGVNCGPAWNGVDLWAYTLFVQKECSDARQTTGIIAGVIAGLGVLIAGGSFLLPNERPAHVA